jgi:hypothetical protein
MNIGMLWFDNDQKKELTVKVERAAQYYRNKYGKKPTLCYVHPSMLPEAGDANHADDNPDEEAGLVTAGVEVRTNQSVLPNHFWIGSNGKSKNGAMTA